MIFLNQLTFVVIKINKVPIHCLKCFIPLNYSSHLSFIPVFFFFISINTWNIYLYFQLTQLKTYKTTYGTSNKQNVQVCGKTDYITRWIFCISALRISEEPSSWRYPGPSGAIRKLWTSSTLTVEGVISSQLTQSTSTSVFFLSYFFIFLSKSYLFQPTQPFN